MNSDKQKAQRILTALVMTDALIRPTLEQSLTAVWKYAIEENGAMFDLPDRVTLDWNNLEVTTAHIERLAGAASNDEIIALARLSGQRRTEALHKLLNDRCLPLWASYGEGTERRGKPGYLLKIAQERKKRHSR